jgi:hypothetical protein
MYYLYLNFSIYLRVLLVDQVQLFEWLAFTGSRIISPPYFPEGTIVIVFPLTMNASVTATVLSAKQ